VHAQNTNNPFELTPRLPEPVSEPDTIPKEEEASVPGNPFDIVASKGTPLEKEKTFTIPKAIPTPEINTSQKGLNNSFLFPVIISILLLLTLFITLFGSYVSRIYRAIFNDNMLHQLFTDRHNAGLTAAFVPLYLLFFINVGFFTFLTVNYFKATMPPGNNYLLLLYFTLSILTFFLLKHLILIIIGSIFPVKKETISYNFTIVVFSIFIGLALVPLNISIAYMPSYMTKWLIFGTLIFIVLTYVLRTLRGLFLADKFLRFHKFHFLLYLCTVEIAPVLFLYRFFIYQLQG
jgi:hypothetical protein